MLFEPVKLGNLTLPNRFVLPAMQRGWGKDYAPTPRLTGFYRKCVAGGTPLIITEAVAIDHPSATWQSSFVLMLNNDTREAWRECIDGVHEEGGIIFLQLWHEGAIRREGQGPYPDAPTLSASGLIQKGRPNGRAATTQELDEIRAAYVRGAIMAQELGADGIELQSAHGYFLDQFLWPETNLRTDQYGGNILKRASFAANIIADIRKHVGPDFVIGIRFSQWKEVDFAARIVATAEELAEMVTLWEQAGADFFHCSARRFYEGEWPPDPRGLAGWTKALTNAVVIANGSVGVSVPLIDTFAPGLDLHDTSRTSASELENRLANSEFDLVSVGRANIADPSWSAKVQAGNYGEIQPFCREMLNEALEEWDADLIEEVTTHIKGAVRT